MTEDTPRELLEALEHFRQRGVKTIALEKLMENSNLLDKVDFNDLESIEGRAKLYIEIAQARYDSGNLSEHELLFHRCFALEQQVHESRASNGAYSDVLDPISNKMREVERKYGLRDDEYWPISNAPEEYLELSRDYDDVLEQKMLDTFCEFGANDLKELYLEDREEFESIHNIGYMSVFLKDEKSKLLVLASIYENEAFACSSSEAFFAASVMLSSAIESRLIITCMEKAPEVRETLKKMGLSNKDLKSKNPLTWKLETLINVCYEAGWIPIIDTGRFTYSGQAMLNYLRKIRNNVHPAAKLKRGGGMVMGEEQFKDIKYIYQLLASALTWPKDSPFIGGETIKPQTNKDSD